MHIPTVCLPSSSSFWHLHRLVSHHEPLLRCFSQHHRIGQKEITHRGHSEPLWTVDIPLHVRHTGQSCPHRGISLVSCHLRDALCHIFGKQTRGAGGLGVLLKHQDMVLIKSYAQWHNHCSFCAVVVVSLAHEDQVEKCRERVSERREGKRETDNNPEDISEDTGHLRQRRHLGENEASDTSRATWFGWSVAQDSWSICHQGSRSWSCVSCKLIMLFRFRWVPLS